jgi:AcrR family transcriptional regulator
MGNAEPHTARRGAFVKGQRTREAIMQAAQVVFAREGFMNADIAQIAEEAGKGKGTFYLYFESKLHLLTAMIEAFARDLWRPEGLKGPFNPPEQIDAVLGAIWNTYKRHAATFRALADASAKHPEFAEKFREIRSYALRDFAAMIRARQAAGFCQHLDAEYAAVALEQMVCHSINEWLADGPGVLSTPAAERRAFGSLVSIMRAALALPDDSAKPPKPRKALPGS